ncbi:hypothetical protein [Streptomyces sp. SCSIO 30461]|uniref:hypothetical protein n=1 Tax=Streptomyces sp. SCSIO 30461 TaxID=3118085 RepID=UPI00387E5C7F
MAPAAGAVGPRPGRPARRRPAGPVLAAPPLHRRHAAWAVVTVPTGPEEGRVRGRIRALLGELEASGVADAHAWPRPLAADGTDTGAARTRYAIGLGGTPPDRDRLGAIADRWLRGLPGAGLTWAGPGEVPTLPAGPALRA